MSDTAPVRVDHGARGQANRDRPQRFVETIQAGVTARQYDDSHPIDRWRACAQLSDRQHAAAVIVLIMHDEAGFEPNVCSGYAPSGWGRGHDDESAENAAVTRFRELLNGKVRDGKREASISDGSAFLLHGMALGQHPGIARLGSLQAALSDLAKAWNC